MAQATSVRQENKMGVMPVDKLLITMSLPMMISMLVQALYNIVDSIFVSQINEHALRAVSLAFPIQSLMIAVSVGTAVGINAFLSKTLGQKQYDKANIIAVNGIFIEVVSAVVFALVGLFVSRPFFMSQTDIQQVQQYKKRVEEMEQKLKGAAPSMRDFYAYRLKSEKAAVAQVLSDLLSDMADLPGLQEEGKKKG